MLLRVDDRNTGAATRVIGTPLNPRRHHRLLVLIRQQRLGWIGKVAYGVVSRLSAFGAGVAQSAAAKCAIWSACAFTKDGRAVARAT